MSTQSSHVWQNRLSSSINSSTNDTVKYASCCFSTSAASPSTWHPGLLSPHQRQTNLGKFNHANLHTPIVRSWFGDARLTPTQVDYRLRRYEFSHQVDSKDGVSFVSNELRSNNPIEDRRAKAKVKGDSDAMMFGVFDGHRGPACAQAISERLFNYIAAEVLPYDQLMHAHHMFNKGEWKEMVDWFNNPNHYTSQEWAFVYQRSLHRYIQDNVSIDIVETMGEHSQSIMESLMTAFDRLDKDLTTEALTPGVMNDEALHTVFSGTCACVAYIDGRDLYVANTGDCRAVLGSQDADGFWSAHNLSIDHNSHNNDEVKRLRESHPLNETSTVIKNGRLLSELAPLRAFGDVRYKWPAATQRNVLNPWFGSDVVPRSYHTPPYLVATPEVQHHVIESHDEFLILGSDGLWDCMSPQKAVSLVGEHLLLQKSVGSFENQQLKLGDIKQQLMQRRDALHPVDKNAATHLIRYAIGGAQNQFDHDRLAHTLSLPDDIARQYRDDITVIIVYFS